MLVEIVIDQSLPEDLTVFEQADLQSMLLAMLTLAVMHEQAAVPM
jgi:uncharacterized protein YfaT (DUF1175 family)